MVLADTAVWVDYLKRGRRGRGAPLDALLEANQVVIVGPIAAELVAGTKDDERLQLWRRILSVPWVELDRDGWRRVGEVFGALVAEGRTVPLTDVTIAVAAVTAGAQLWTTDTDFDRLREQLPQLQRFTPE